MSKNICTSLSPLLIIGYVLGLRIIGFPADYPKLWFGILYVLLLWSIYFFLLIYTAMSYIAHYSLEYHICLRLNIITALLSIVSDVYHEKKFRDCLNKLAMIDNTLKKLGIMTDYQKLLSRIIWRILGYCVACMLWIYGESLWFGDQYHLNFATAIYLIYTINHCIIINVIGDVSITSIIGYIGLKFDQVNEYFRQLLKGNELEVTQAWKNSMLRPRQRRFPKAPNSEWTMWIIIHLHVELCKISREINSIFGIQMTLKMGCYFGYMVLGCRELFNVILIKNYINRNVVFFIVVLYIIFLYTIRLFLINYLCEKVSAKANVTGDIVNKILYSTCNVEVCEDITQFLLQMTRAPLRFCGLGLFQFGYKFFYGFSKSVTTVLVIYIQAHM